jgi:hypothetical protein
MLGRNHFCGKQSNTEIVSSQYGCESGYFVGVFYVLIVITLYRVQAELEDPFKGTGPDDIHWEIWRAQLDQMSMYGPDGVVRRQRNADAPYQGAA